MMTCWKCGYELEAREQVSFRAECPDCGGDLHVCRNCEFYDPAYHNECREPMAERVVDKERANFCEYFRPAPGRKVGLAKEGRAGSARAQLETLFKKGR